MPKVSPARVYAYSFASIHALYVTKVERKAAPPPAKAGDTLDQPSSRREPGSVDSLTESG